jgi:hypothetical protein
VRVCVCGVWCVCVFMKGGGVCGAKERVH